MRRKLIRMTAHDVTLGLLKGQLHFLNQDMEVILVAKDTGKLKRLAEREGVAYRDVNMHREISPLNDLRSLWSLWKLFRHERPDILHANTPKGALLGMLAAKLAGVKNRIYNVNGLRFETTQGNFRKLLIMMEKITCACATKVIPQSNGVKDVLLHERITSKPLNVIRYGSGNGVDIEYFNPDSPEIRNEANNINRAEGFENKTTFVFVGRIVGDKGVNELVEAFDCLADERKDVTLRLLGNYEEELDPVKTFTKSKIESHPYIVHEGYKNDIRPYLGASSVFVLPSYREGFPNVVLQAAAMGLPCIVSDVNGAIDVIKDGHNGLIVPKRDKDALYYAMKELADNATLRAGMAANARQIVVNKFRMQDVWQATLDMYNNL